MTGEYNCSKSSIRPLYEQCVELAENFQVIEYAHKHNTRADGLAKQAANENEYNIYVVPHMYDEQYQEHSGLAYGNSSNW